MSLRVRGNLMLLVTAFIWGSCFVAQRAGMDYLGPFTFTAVRFLLGGTVLIPIMFLFERKKTPLERRPADTLPDAPAKPESLVKKERKMLWIGGLVCGFVLFFAASVQQVGLQYTTAGKAGFITSLYIILVPVLGLFLRKKVRHILWFCIFLGTVGLYFLCITESFSIGRGDFIMLFAALGYGIHILSIDYFAPKVDSIKLSAAQFYACSLVCFIPAFIFETPRMADILLAWFPLLYAGIISCGIAYTFQTIAQKYTDPTVTSLILSLESVFAVLTGFVILHEVLSLRELFGCALMLFAIILSQLPARQPKPPLE